MSIVYDNFESHDRAFNAFFATSIAIVASFLIGGFLASIRFFNNSYAWFVAAILIVTPVIVFVAVANEPEFKTAYYRTWKDKISGRLDQRKILEQFAKRYKIKNWHTKLESMEADGRWHFHADTNYMHRLVDRRDLLISQVYQEYLKRNNELKKAIIAASKNFEDACTELQFAESAEANAKKMLEVAEPPAGIYNQRQEYGAILKRLNECMKNRNEANRIVQTLRQETNQLLDDFKETIYRIVKIYYIRYSKYTELAIKKINRINGLKYAIMDMPEPRIRLNNLERKE